MTTATTNEHVKGAAGNQPCIRRLMVRVHGLHARKGSRCVGNHHRCTCRPLLLIDSHEGEWLSTLIGPCRPAGQPQGAPTGGRAGTHREEETR